MAVNEFQDAQMTYDLLCWTQMSCVSLFDNAEICMFSCVREWVFRHTREKCKLFLLSLGWVWLAHSESIGDYNVKQGIDNMKGVVTCVVDWLQNDLLLIVNVTSIVLSTTRWCSSILNWLYLADMRILWIFWPDLVWKWWCCQCAQPLRVVHHIHW